MLTWRILILTKIEMVPRLLSEAHVTSIVKQGLTAVKSAVGSALIRYRPFKLFQDSEKKA